MLNSDALQLKVEGKWERAHVEVAGERIGYYLYEIDARTAEQRERNARQRSLDGNLIVYIPGHAQRATTAKRLHAELIAQSASKVIWSVDIDPPRNGDPAKAEALVQIIKERTGQGFLGADSKEQVVEPPFGITLIGWSHGGAEALRAANAAPALFQHVAALCPSGLTERSLRELVLSFSRESIRIGWNIVRTSLSESTAGLVFGADLLRGILTDLFRTRSARRLIGDARWAGKKLVGEDYAYDGTVVVLFGESDSVIRWKDVFPDCQHPDDIDQALTEYRKKDFPRVRSVKVQVLEGNHMAPETSAPVYIKTAFHLMLGRKD
jgi:pimeloyl-ACP methyl ester carboxylesterase